MRRLLAYASRIGPISDEESRRAAVSASFPHMTKEGREDLLRAWEGKAAARAPERRSMTWADLEAWSEARKRRKATG